jgi:hypothetical protein
VESPDMNIEHLSQELLIVERIACEIELDLGAIRAMRPQEIVLWLGVDYQFRTCHAFMMPQARC